jgi:deoxyadenosine/deoxycytidine kinase
MSTGASDGYGMKGAFIGISGIIGAGKSTLAKVRFAQHVVR